MNNKKRKRKIGPCPDPEQYILVDSKHGQHWRRKRGTVKPAALNAKWEASKRHTAISSPAAKRIIEKLIPFTENFASGEKSGTISGMLRKSLNEKGIADYSFFKGYDIQQEYPLDALLKERCTIKQQKGVLHIVIPVNNKPVTAKNKLATAYYFEAVLLYGDPTEINGLRVESDLSTSYLFNKSYKVPCTLTLQVPADKIWVVWLKVGCMEGDEPAHHPKHYGMRVVAINS